MTLQQAVIEIAYIVLPLLVLQWLLASRTNTRAR
jgi:hypothetical protein